MLYNFAITYTAYTLPYCTQQCSYAKQLYGKARGKRDKLNDDYDHDADNT